MGVADSQTALAICSLRQLTLLTARAIDHCGGWIRKEVKPTDWVTMLRRAMLK